MNESRLDRSVEALVRWTAKRTTRRSFLHTFSRFLVVLAAGPTIATLLTRTASARVCGQSGVTKKCTSFACEGPGHVWGWCWYASDGCCRNDGLKKICDCCVENYPNVHGYCPSGTNVACIVESCGEDPRLTPVDLVALPWESSFGYTGAAIDWGHAAAHRIVVADGTTWWRPVFAAPLAGALGSPLFQVDPSGGLAPNDRVRIERLGAAVAMVVGAADSPAVDELRALGLEIEVVSDATDAATASIAVADRLRTINAIHRSVTLPAGVTGGAVAELAAVFAAGSGFAVAYNTAVADSLGMPTVVIGTDQPTPSAVSFETVAIDDPAALSRRLAELAATSPFVERRRLVLAPVGTSDLVGFTNLGLPVVLHTANVLGDLSSWLEQRGLADGKWERIFHTSGPGELTEAEFWRLQGTVNGFRVDDLQGVSGQGLPVIRQPLAERPIGMARVDGALPWGSDPDEPYWTSVAQTFRGDG